MRRDEEKSEIVPLMHKYSYSPHSELWLSLGKSFSLVTNHLIVVLLHHILTHSRSGETGWIDGEANMYRVVFRATNQSYILPYTPSSNRYDRIRFSSPLCIHSVGVFFSQGKFFIYVTMDEWEIMRSLPAATPSHAVLIQRKINHFKQLQAKYVRETAMYWSNTWPSLTFFLVFYFFFFYLFVL